MPKPLCKIKKLLKTDLELYIHHVQDPRFVCESCGRVARKKKWLCKSVRMTDLANGRSSGDSCGGAPNKPK